MKVCADRCVRSNWQIIVPLLALIGLGSILSPNLKIATFFLTSSEPISPNCVKYKLCLTTEINFAYIFIMRRISSIEHTQRVTQNRLERYVIALNIVRIMTT